MAILKKWYDRFMADADFIILVLILIVGFAIILTMGDILAPVLFSLVLAYLLDSLVSVLESLRVPRLLAVLIVFTGFVSALVGLFGFVLPLIWSQALSLGDQLPAMINKGRGLLQKLTELYPSIFNGEKLNQLFAPITQNLQKFGEVIVSFALSTVPNLLAFCVYLILIPILVFFFLKDKVAIMNWFNTHLPKNRELATRVNDELNNQIGLYIKGKIIEIIIVAAASYFTFLAFGLNYAALLAMLVGLSVVVPYVGAIVVTIPVALVGFFQWGLVPQFGWLVFAYFIIQALDGNVLVPWLFSEAVDLHPIVIIISILLFGGLWGFWGVFFAIPLAILCKAVFYVLPRDDKR